MSRKVVITLLLVFAFCNFSSALAQEVGLMNTMNRASQYQLGDKDQILMNVNVWGFVSRPGQYLVPRNTDLISLISFAGGPVEGAELGKVKVVRGGELLQASNGHDNKVSILTADVKGNLETGEIGKIPVLMAGDTVIIPQTRGDKIKKIFGFNSVLNVITAGTSIALIIYYSTR